jgi:peptide chain release factor 1
MAKELLFSLTKKDFDVQWFSGTGAGGQHRNKHQNCCRLYHPASGVRVTGQSHRDRVANQREAFNNLRNHPKFKVWFNRKVTEALMSETAEERVAKQLDPVNIKIEAKDDEGRWVEIKPEELNYEN